MDNDGSITKLSDVFTRRFLLSFSNETYFHNTVILTQSSPSSPEDRTHKNTI